MQNIITNDVRLLETQPSLYACFLSPQGKFLHDFFITHDGDSYLLECEGGARVINLQKKMKLFKIGLSVDLSCSESIDVFSILSGTTAESVPDPRHPQMGQRSFVRPHHLPEQPFDRWDMHRLRLGIPDGSRDMMIEQDTLIDCTIDRLNGISFQKGCYIGQEITARMHLRGTAKKHLYPVEILSGPAPAPGSDIHINGKLAGQMRSHCGNIGLAMIRDEMIPALAHSPIRPLAA